MTEIVSSGSDLSNESDEDFESIFTVSKKTVEGQLNKKILDRLEDGDKPSGADIDQASSTLTQSVGKRSRVVLPIPAAIHHENSTPEVVYVPSPRDQGRGRRRGRGSRCTRRSTRAKELNILSPEFVQNRTGALNWSLDDTLKDDSVDSIDDDNHDISVKVCWKSKTVTPFSIRKYQKLSSVFEYYAKQEGIKVNQLQFTLGDRFISPDDTPDSLSLTVASILEGGILTSAVTNAIPAAPIPAGSPADENSIKLKIRAKDTKQPVMIRIKKTQKMSVLMAKYAEQFEIPIAKLKFSFDGETINAHDTPEDLDLEGDEMIDLFIAA